MLRILVFSLLVFGLAACGGDGTYDVDVRLVSDFVPGPEVSRVTTEIFTGDVGPSSRSAERQERALRFGDAVARGLSVARFRGIAQGPYSIKVSVEGPNGEVLASRVVSTAVSASRTYTVHITRECATVVCPGAGNAGDSACLAGRCVDPRCTAEDRTHCPPDVFCSADENCATESTCGAARCDEGVCVFEEREGGCGETEWCAREEGCAPLEPPDLPGGPDARCGTICRLPDEPCRYGYYACTTQNDGATSVVCTSFLTRPVGAPCGEGLVCDETTECVDAPDAGVASDASIDGGALFEDAEIDAAADAASEPIDAAVEPCAEGFEREGGVCVDIDECAPLGAAACDGAGTCMNTPGSYECACEPGYDGTGSKDCVDIDECTTLLPCDMLVDCENTEGGFTCGDCPAGYGGGGGDVCTDVDECDLGLDACGRGDCNNLDGGYECDCPAGYSGSGTTSCIDIDECAVDNGGCDGLTECTNVAGGYECGACPDGFTGDGGSGCVDINECLTSNGGCDGNAACANTVGGNTCTCNPGYIGSGTTCNDIDECATNNGGCDSNAACANTVGSSTCTCNPGYTGSGTTCNDIDECATNNGGCGSESFATCVNEPGSRSCVCRAGFTLVGDTCVPAWVEDGYLKASVPGESDVLGFAVAISSDGNTLAVGAWGEDSNATGINQNANNNSAADSGAVYVYRRVGGVWSQEAYIKASNTEATDYFGTGVALSGDGNVLFVGAPAEDSSATTIDGSQANGAGASGAVYVFRFAAGAWSQATYIKPSNSGVGDYFGWNVRASHDGRTLAVSAPYEDSSSAATPSNNGATDSGAVYVFSYDGAAWTQQAYLKASNIEANDLFALDMALSGDGDTLVVTSTAEASNATGINGLGNNNLAPGSGAAYVYRRAAGVWSFDAYIKASNTSTNDLFGDDVALSFDGTTLAVGARDEDSSATGVGGDQNDNTASQSGAVYLFRRTSGEWSQTAYLKSSNSAAGHRFGGAVALSDDGTRLVVASWNEGASTRNIGLSATPTGSAESGAVYLLEFAEGVWTENLYFKASNADAGDQLASDLAMAGDGSTFVGTSQGEDGNGTSPLDNSLAGSGATYVFRHR